MCVSGGAALESGRSRSLSRLAGFMRAVRRHEAHENQEFKRLLPILEQHTCVHTHDAELRRQALLDQATAITSRHLSQPLQVSKWNKDTQALLATAGFGEHGRQGRTRAAQKRRKVESECGAMHDASILPATWRPSDRFRRRCDACIPTH